MYHHIAHYYDLIHAQLTADIPLLQTVAQQTGGPILELGCGTGRLLRPLAQAGYGVTGVDNSAAMLDRCREMMAAEPAVAARINLIESDMLALAEVLENTKQFGLVIIGHNTLMHLSLPQVNELLRRLRPYLTNTGQLFIDVANPFVLAETADTPYLTLENQFIDPETADHILQFATTRLDAEAQICHVTWLFDTFPAAGGPVQRHLSQMTYHYFYPHELELVLQAAGYRLRHLWGSYDQAPFIEESERLLLLATNSSQ
jgi:SAM-dependent methyltransferase